MTPPGPFHIVFARRLDSHIASQAHRHRLTSFPSVIAAALSHGGETLEGPRLFADFEERFGTSMWHDIVGDGKRAVAPTLFVYMTRCGIGSRLN